jgi:hypothetical protein
MRDKNNSESQTETAKFLRPLVSFTLVAVYSIVKDYHAFSIA